MDGSARDAGAKQAIRGSTHPWTRAIAGAALMLLASFLLLAIVPNQLLTYLSRHVAPKARDLLVTTWWVAAFLFCCWLFVRLQQGREK